MNIFIISRGIPSTQDPQFGIFELEQAIALRDIGHTVSVLAFDTRMFFSRNKIGIEKISYQGIECYRVYLAIPFFLFPVKLKLWIFQRVFLRLFNKVCAFKGKPDIVHAHYAFCMARAAMIKRKYPNIKFVGTEHWSKMGSGKNSINKYVEIGYPAIDKMITVSHNLQNILKKEYNKDSVVINNMVDTESFVYNPTKRNEKEFHFIAVGSLIKRKKFDLLIKAFERCEWDSSVHLDIVGGGVEYENLKKLIAKLNLQNQVHLHGRKCKEEIIAFLQSSNAFVLSSKLETFSVVCIEALSSGLPVVATICGGPEEFITKENGILVPVNNVEKLANAMRKIYSDYAKYDPLLISHSCKEKFSREHIARQITEVYKEVLGK